MKHYRMAFSLKSFAAPRASAHLPARVDRGLGKKCEGLNNAGLARPVGLRQLHCEMCDIRR
jgi:hypothetical protein